MVHFYHILHTYACQHSLNYDMRTHLLLIDMGLLCNCPACCVQLVKIIITLEPYGIFESNFAHLFILICPAKCMLNDDNGLLSIILAGQSILVKMLISLKPRVYFNQILHTNTF